VISSARSSPEICYYQKYLKIIKNLPRIELQPSTILDRSNEPGYGFREYTLSRYCRHLIGHMILNSDVSFKKSINKRLLWPV